MDTVHRAGKTYVKATVAELEGMWGHSPDEWGWAADTPRERVLWLHIERDALHIETERTETDRHGFLEATDGAGRARLIHVDRWTARELGQQPGDVFLDLYSEAQKGADMKARVYANGEDMGVYEGESKEAILDAYAQDAGYEDFADLIRQVPDATRDEVTLEPAE